MHLRSRTPYDLQREESIKESLFDAGWDLSQALAQDLSLDPRHSCDDLRSQIHELIPCSLLSKTLILIL